MSSLNIIPRWLCQTAQQFEIQVGNHTIRHDSFHHQTRYQYDWSCSCSAYRDGFGSYCKHILEVQSLSLEEGGRCGWHQGIQGGDVDHNEQGEPCCPGCGGPVTTEQWGV